MSDLTEFLLARIAEDEEAAKAASPSPWKYGDVESVAGGSLYDKTRMIASLHYEQPTDHDGTIVRHLLSDEADANGAHIARHDPARVLAECEAKRRIVEVHAKIREAYPGMTIEENPCCAECSAGGEYPSGWPCATLAAIASIYADHPDYREEWRP